MKVLEVLRQAHVLLNQAKMSAGKGKPGKAIEELNRCLEFGTHALGSLGRNDNSGYESKEAQKEWRELENSFNAVENRIDGSANAPVKKEFAVCRSNIRNIRRHMLAGETDKALKLMRVTDALLGQVRGNIETKGPGIQTRVLRAMEQLERQVAAAEDIIEKNGGTMARDLLAKARELYSAAGKNIAEKKYEQALQRINYASHLLTRVNSTEKNRNDAALKRAESLLDYAGELAISSGKPGMKKILGMAEKRLARARKAQNDGDFQKASVYVDQAVEFAFQVIKNAQQ